MSKTVRKTYRRNKEFIAQSGLGTGEANGNRDDYCFCAKKRRLRQRLGEE